MSHAGLQVDDNTIQLERDLAQFMYSLRIDAEVAVIEVVTWPFSHSPCLYTFVKRDKEISSVTRRYPA